VLGHITINVELLSRKKKL